MSESLSITVHFDNKTYFGRNENSVQTQQITISIHTEKTDPFIFIITFVSFLV